MGGSLQPRHFNEGIDLVGKIWEGWDWLGLEINGQVRRWLFLNKRYGVGLGRVRVVGTS